MFGFRGLRADLGLSGFRVQAVLVVGFWGVRVARGLAMRSSQPSETKTQSPKHRGIHFIFPQHALNPSARDLWLGGIT